MGPGPTVSTSHVGNTLAYQYRNFDCLREKRAPELDSTSHGLRLDGDGTLLVGDAGTTASILGNIDNRATLGGGTIVGNVTNLAP